MIDAHIPDKRLPFLWTAGRTGVLFLHGFMGSPLSCRPIAHQLHTHGLTVHAPLLPGHGHFPARLANVSRTRWLREAEHALAQMRSHCDEVFLIGHSMGAVLAAHLAVNNPDIRGVAVLAPLFNVPSRGIYLMPVAQYLLPYLYPLRHRLVDKHVIERRVLDFDATVAINDPAVQAQLDEWAKLPTSGLNELRKMAKYGRALYPHIYQPAMVMQGQLDDTLDPALAQRLFNLLPSPRKQLHRYPNSDHELMRPDDPAHQQVWSTILSFIEQYRCQPNTEKLSPG